MKRIGTLLFAIAAVMLIISMVPATAASPATAQANTCPLKGSIYKTLVGYDITYYSIAGKPMHYIVKSSDIGKITSTAYNGRPAWKVRVGSGMTWDFTLDKSGTKVLDIKQLFQT
jgi:hypothetical protein